MQDQPRTYQVEPLGDSIYRARVPSFDGITAVRLSLADAPDISEGRLSNDADTAQALLTYLLQHQDASQLPSPVELRDVVAASPDAIDTVEGLRSR